MTARRLGRKLTSTTRTKPSWPAVAATAPSPPGAHATSFSAWRHDGGERTTDPRPSYTRNEPSLDVAPSHPGKSDSGEESSAASGCHLTAVTRLVCSRARHNSVHSPPVSIVWTLTAPSLHPTASLGFAFSPIESDDPSSPDPPSHWKAETDPAPMESVTSSNTPPCPGTSPPLFPFFRSSGNASCVQRHSLPSPSVQSSIAPVASSAIHCAATAGPAWQSR